MTATTTQAAPTRGDAPVRARGARHLRRDIQGLRAVAVLLVLAFHAGVPAVSGGYVGVDVFFVISGFLITGLLVREVESTGRIDLLRFYARRARRLLPAAALAMAGIAAITVLVLPLTRWRDVAGDLFASTFYVVNWRLAARSVDYMGSEQAASPVQHFWSLAIEEQFYLVWPVLVLLIAWWCARSRRALRPTLLTGLAAATVTSFAWSVVLTASDPSRAYFVTTTRVWELAVGGLLVFFTARFARWARPLRTVLAWAGLAAIGASAFLYDASTAFPGYAALLPVLGTAAVIAAGTGGDAWGVRHTLGAPVMQDVGAVSYSLYLWHWPVIVGATALWGSGEGVLWLPTAVMVAAASAMPAWFAYRSVEKPIHEGPAFAGVRRPLVLGAVCLLLGVMVAGGVVGMANRAAATVTSGPADGDASGARVLGHDPAASGYEMTNDAMLSFTPDPVAAVDDVVDAEVEHCNDSPRGPARLDCLVDARPGEVKVALVGDSHAWHWQPALMRVAQARGWQVEWLTRSSCGFFLGRSAIGDPPVEHLECREYNEALIDHLTGPDGPDLVIASGSNRYKFYRDDGEPMSLEDSVDLLAEAYAEAWRELADAGVPLVVIRNTPWLDKNVPDCLAANPDAPIECAADRDAAEAKSGNAEQRARDAVDSVHFLDMNDWVCPGDRCAPVIGGVTVFRDSHHITATYSRTLAPALERALERAGALP